jgi:hypothetical protein
MLIPDQLNTERSTVVMLIPDKLNTERSTVVMLIPDKLNTEVYCGNVNIMRFHDLTTLS